MNSDYHIDAAFEAYLADLPEHKSLTQEIRRLETSISSLINKRHELYKSETSMTTKAIGIANVAFNLFILSKGHVKDLDFKNPAGIRLEDEKTTLEKELSATKSKLEAANHSLAALLRNSKAAYLNKKQSFAKENGSANPSNSQPRITLRKKPGNFQKDEYYLSGTRVRTNKPLSAVPSNETLANTEVTLDNHPAHSPLVEPTSLTTSEPKTESTPSDTDLLKNDSASLKRISKRIETLQASSGASIGFSDEQKFKHKEDLEGLIRRKEGIERNIAKLEKKISEKREIQELGIKTICIDGSNLCNQTSPREYVGLALLKALVPELIKHFQVIIIFDSNALPKLKESKNSLEKRFPDCILVVSERGCEADPLLIKTANYDPGTFILSNDSFADYRNDPAIKEGRVVRFEAFAQTIHIQSLDLSARYEVD